MMSTQVLNMSLPRGLPHELSQSRRDVSLDDHWHMGNRITADQTTQKTLTPELSHEGLNLKFEFQPV